MYGEREGERELKCFVGGTHTPNGRVASGGVDGVKLFHELTNLRSHRGARKDKDCRRRCGWTCTVTNGWCENDPHRFGGTAMRVRELGVGSARSTAAGGRRAGGGRAGVTRSATAFPCQGINHLRRLGGWFPHAEHLRDDRRLSRRNSRHPRGGVAPARQHGGGPRRHTAEHIARLRYKGDRFDEVARQLNTYILSAPLQNAEPFNVGRYGRGLAAGLLLGDVVQEALHPGRRRGTSILCALIRRRTHYPTRERAHTSHGSSDQHHHRNRHPFTSRVSHCRRPSGFPAPSLCRQNQHHLSGRSCLAPFLSLYARSLGSE